MEFQAAHAVQNLIVTDHTRFGAVAGMCYDGTSLRGIEQSWLALYGFSEVTGKHEFRALAVTPLQSKHGTVGSAHLKFQCASTGAELDGLVSNLADSTGSNAGIHGGTSRLNSILLGHEMANIDCVIHRNNLGDIEVCLFLVI
jgi:hypothetical protein